MNEKWQVIIDRFPKGSIIKAKVLDHKHYGMYLDIGCEPFICFVPITEISESRISISEFPKVNSYVQAVILDYSLDDRLQIWVSIKRVT